MNIIFDCTSAQIQERVLANGGGTYSLRILLEILRCNKNCKISILLSSWKNDSEYIYEIGKNDNLSIMRYDSYKMFGDIVNSGEYDLLFLPIFYPHYSEIKINDNIRVIGLIHDMSTFYHAYLGYQPGQFCKLDGFDWMRKLVYYINKKSSMNSSLEKHRHLFKINTHVDIYTVSYFSKSALNYFIPDGMVKDVFYSPLKEVPVFTTIEETAVLEKYSIGYKNYILMSNICRGQKNNIRVVKALDELFSDSKYSFQLEKMNVILCGCTSSNEKYIKKIVKNPHKFIYDGFISDINMEILYKNAYVYIYPSLLEGFGYPPIEAMRQNTLSICSTSTSIPEICGDAVIYFNPLDMDSFKMALLRALNETYYKSFELKMRKHYENIKTIQEKDMKRLVGAILNGTN